MESKYGLTEMENDACDKAATEAFEKLKNPLDGALKKITDSIHESLHDYLMDWMESDLQSNFAGLVRTRSERIISGLFNGSYDEETAKQWLVSYDFEKYREAAAKNYPDIIKEKLIDDLTTENKRLKEQLEWMRSR
jgi:hypothetical protein